MKTCNSALCAAAFSIVVLGALAHAARADDDERENIVGVWTCDGGPAPFKVIKTFAAEGTMMEIDNIAFQESPTVGVWKHTGSLHYVLIARQFAFDPDGAWAGTYLYSQPLVMSASRETMKGTYHATFVDASGKSSDAGDGFVSCVRMTFPR